MVSSFRKRPLTDPAENGTGLRRPGSKGAVVGLITPTTPLSQQTVAIAPDEQQPSNNLGLEPGAHLGRYYLSQRVALVRGGAFFFAYDTLLCRRVALLILQVGTTSLRVHGAKAVRSSAMLNRARGLAAVQASAWPPVLDLAGDSERMVIALEWPLAQPIATWLATVPPFSVLVGVLHQVGEAVLAAQNLGFEPEYLDAHSVFVSENGQAVLCPHMFVGRPARQTRAASGSSTRRDHEPSAQHASTNQAPLAPIKRVDTAAAFADWSVSIVLRWHALRHPWRKRTPVPPIGKLRAEQRADFVQRRLNIPSWLSDLLVECWLAQETHRPHSLAQVVALLGVHHATISPWRSWLTATSFAAGLLCAAIAVHRQESGRCEVPRERWDGVWDQGIAAELRERATADSGEVAGAAVGVLTSILNAKVEHWREDYQDLCRLTGDKPTAATQSIRQCLENQVDATQALVSELWRDPSLVVRHGNDLVAALTDGNSCAVGLFANKSENHEQTMVGVGLRAEISQLGWAAALENAPDVADRIADVRDEALTLRLPRVAVEAEIQRLRSLRSQESPASWSNRVDSLTLFCEAVAAGRACEEAVYMQAVASLEQPQSFATMEEAIFRLKRWTQQGGSDSNTIALHSLRGVLSRARGDHQQMVASMRDALVVMRQHVARHSGIDFAVNLAYSLAATGALDEAADELWRTWNAASGRLLVIDGDLVDWLRYMAILLEQAGRFDAVNELLEAVAQRIDRQNHSVWATWTRVRADIELRNGAIRVAKSRLSRSDILPILQTTAEREPRSWVAQELLVARMAWHAGAWSQVIAHAQPLCQNIHASLLERIDALVLVVRAGYHLPHSEREAHLATWRQDALEVMALLSARGEWDDWIEGVSLALALVMLDEGQAAGEVLTRMQPHADVFDANKASPMTAKIAQVQAEVALRRGNLGAALDFAQRAWAAWSVLVGPDDVRTMHAMLTLAAIERERGHGQAFQEWLAQARLSAQGIDVPADLQIRLQRLSSGLHAR